MQIDDQTRTNLNRAFVSVLRGSQVAASINLQRASLALFTIIEHTADGEPIDLGALLFYFTHEAKIPEGPATELCVVLKRGMATGYAGVENPLFFHPHTQMLFGDAREKLAELVTAVKA